MADPTRPSADQILDRVLVTGTQAVTRPPLRLGFSALFAGLAMGLTGLGVAAALAAGASRPAALLLYPLGFLAVILGRAQLFTENTLYPVVLTLDDRSFLGRTARLWAIVFAANVLGALVFAFLAVRTGALGAEVEREVRTLGAEAVLGDFGVTFWSGVLGGFVIALVAWLVEAADDVAGQVLLVFALTYVVGLAQLDHCIASAAYVLGDTLDGGTSAGEFARWLTAATLGNTAGGVLIVALLNYGQVRSPAAGGG